MRKNAIISLILTGFLVGCMPSYNKIKPPKYLSLPNIELDVKNIEAQNILVKIEPEMERMLGFPASNSLQDWVDLKFKTIGQTGKVIIKFSQASITELTDGEYAGNLSIDIEFIKNDKVCKKITTSAKALKSFDTLISFARKRVYLYDLLQDLIAEAHTSIIATMNNK